ncbi:MAG: hypothetical protein AAF362_20200 [Pseudomonadota bacterium]
MYKYSRILIAALTMIAAASTIAPVAANAQTGRVDLQIVKVGFIVGLSGGRGTLYYDGLAYPIRIGGVSLGPSFAVSSIDLTGTAYNLNRVEDFYGTYTAGSAGLALVGGGETASLSNARGVRLEVVGRTIGVEFSLDLSGISIQPR